MVDPGSRPSPLVSRRIPIPAVWKSIVVKNRSDLISPSYLALRLVSRGVVLAGAIRHSARGLVKTGNRADSEIGLDSGHRRD